MSRLKCPECNVTKPRSQFPETDTGEELVCTQCTNKSTKPAKNHNKGPTHLYAADEGKWIPVLKLGPTQRGVFIKIISTSEHIEVCQPDRLTEFDQALVNQKHLIQFDAGTTTPTINTEAKSKSDETTQQTIIADFAEDNNNDNSKDKIDVNSSTGQFALQLVREILQNQSMNLNNANSLDYTRLMYEDRKIRKFKGKFPTNESEFWIYSNTIHIFKNEHTAIEEARLLDKILRTCSAGIRQQWNDHKNAKYLSMEDDNRTEQEIRDSFNTFDTFESFIIDLLSISPTIHYFKRQISYIRAAYNENPMETHRRIHTYLNQVKVAITKINANSCLTYDVRPIGDQEKKELYERVFIADNNKPAFGNNGPLNNKVKMKMDQFIQRLPGYLLSQFIDELKKVQFQILPASCIDSQVPNKHWTKFRSTCTIFNHKPFNQINQSRKRALEDASNDGRPPAKKTRRSTERCNGGNHCQYYLKTGKCKYQHTMNEIKAMNKKRQQHQSQNSNNSGNNNNNNRKGKTPSFQTKSKRPWSKTTQNGKDSNSAKSGYSKPCKWGTACYLWQQNRCTYYHNTKQMSCGYCQKSGHSTADCRARQRQPPPRGPPPPPQSQYIPRYNPITNPNANTPMPHALAMHTNPAYYPYYPTYPNVPNHPIQQIDESKSSKTINPNHPNALNDKIKSAKSSLRDAKQTQDKLKNELLALQAQKRLTMSPNEYRDFLDDRYPRQY